MFIVQNNIMNISLNLKQSINIDSKMNVKKLIFYMNETIFIEEAGPKPSHQRQTLINLSVPQHQTAAAGKAFQL